MSKKYYDKILAGSGTSSVKVKSAFGSKILAKYGWKEGQGLGATMTGVSECVQIERRDERVGIGAEKKDADSQWDNWWSGAYDSVAAKINVKIGKSINSKNSDNSSSSSDSEEDEVVTPRVEKEKKKKSKKEKKKKRVVVEESESSSEDERKSAEEQLHKKRRVKRHVRDE